MLWDRVESEGPSGTSHGLSLLLRRHVAGSDGPAWEDLGLAHNPEVEGSNPSPATKLTRDFAPHLLSGVGGVARFGSRIGSISAGDARRGGVRAFEDESGDSRGRLLIQARDDVAVGVQGDLDVGVPQALADDLGRDAGGEGRGRVAVAHVVQAD